MNDLHHRISISCELKIGKLNREKHLCVSSIGHTLHKSEPEFEKLTFSDKIKVESNGQFD